MRQTIASTSDVLTFGKHKGKTIQQVADTNWPYVEWALENGVIQVSTKIYNELFGESDRHDNDWQDGHPMDFGDN